MITLIKLMDGASLTGVFDRWEEAFPADTVVTLEDGKLYLVNGTSFSIGNNGYIAVDAGNYDHELLKIRQLAVLLEGRISVENLDEGIAFIIAFGASGYNAETSPPVLRTGDNERQFLKDHSFALGLTVEQENLAAEETSRDDVLVRVRTILVNEEGFDIARFMSFDMDRMVVHSSAEALFSHKPTVNRNAVSPVVDFQPNYRAGFTSEFTSLFEQSEYLTADEFDIVGDVAWFQKGYLYTFHTPEYGQLDKVQQEEFKWSICRQLCSKDIWEIVLDTRGDVYNAREQGGVWVRRFVWSEKGITEDEVFVSSD